MNLRHRKLNFCKLNTGRYNHCKENSFLPDNKCLPLALTTPLAPLALLYTCHRVEQVTSEKRQTTIIPVLQPYPKIEMALKSCDCLPSFTSGEKHFGECCRTTKFFSFSWKYIKFTVMLYDICPKLLFMTLVFSMIVAHFSLKD